MQLCIYKFKTHIFFLSCKPVSSILIWEKKNVLSYLFQKKELGKKRYIIALNGTMFKTKG